MPIRRRRNPRHEPGVPPGMDTRKRPVWLLLLVVLLAACASTMSSPTHPAAPFDANGDWVLESGTVAGAPLPMVADYPITLSIDGEQVGGQSACNDYGGRIELIDGQVRITETSGTAMRCGDGDAVMRSEEIFLRALSEVRDARGEGDRLTLVGPTVELVFTRRAPLPMAELVGTDWILESITDGDVVRAAIGQPALLRLEGNGTFDGSTGCRTFTGSWVEAQGHLVATQTTMAGECPGGLGGQDGVVAEALGGSLPAIEGDRLTLSKPGGVELVYRRATE
jgi:heat shock protein HslJ